MSKYNGSLVGNNITEVLPQWGSGFFLNQFDLHKDVNNSKGL